MVLGCFYSSLVLQCYQFVSVLCGIGQTIFQNLLQRHRKTEGKKSLENYRRNSFSSVALLTDIEGGADSLNCNKLVL